MSRIGSILWLAVGIALGPGAVAGEASGPSQRPRYEVLHLGDGRTLKDVLVRSYDARAEAVLLVASGKAIVVPKAILPAGVREKVDRLPIAGETVNTLPETKPSPDGGRPLSPEASTPSARRAGPAATTTSTPTNLKVHQDLARARARRFFEFELPGVPDHEHIEAMAFEMGPVAAIPGWTGQYRVEGTAMIRYLDWRTLQSRRLTARFEVTTEQKPGEEPRVIDFARKN